MSEWVNKYDLTGKPLITVDKPGNQIEKVLDELQEKSINEIEGDDGSGDTPIAIDVEMLDNQTAKISASIDLSDLQEKSINEIEGDDGSGDTPIAIDVEMLDNQTAKISASIDLSDLQATLPPGTVQYQVLVWSGSEWYADYVRAT